MIVCSVANMAAGPAPTPTPPIANFDWTPRDPIAGEIVQFQDTSLQEPTSWSWTRNGIVFSTERNPTLYFSLPGIYTIQLTATNFFGSNTATGNVTVERDR